MRIFPKVNNFFRKVLDFLRISSTFPTIQKNTHRNKLPMRIISSKATTTSLVRKRR